MTPRVLLCLHTHFHTRMHLYMQGGTQKASTGVLPTLDTHSQVRAHCPTWKVRTRYYLLSFIGEEAKIPRSLTSLGVKVRRLSRWQVQSRSLSS